MVSYRFAVFAAASALLFSSASWAASAAERPAAGVDGAKLILAYLNVGHRPVGLSTPLTPVAESCKDKCETDRDKCFNACPSDAIEGSVCRDGCSDTYDKCQKGC